MHAVILTLNKLMQFLENKNKIFSLLSRNKKCMQEICHVTSVNYAIEANQVNSGVLSILAGVGGGKKASLVL